MYINQKENLCSPSPYCPALKAPLEIDAGDEKSNRIREVEGVGLCCRCGPLLRARGEKKVYCERLLLNTNLC